MSVPPISLRDINLDTSSRAIGGTAWMDGGGWTVATGSANASPVIARSDTPGLTAGLAGGAAGGGSMVLWAVGALLAVVLLSRVLR